VWLRENTAPETVIAVSAAGAVPYFSERPAIDMLGLNDPHIAHDGKIEDSAPTAHKRYDAAYVLDREPDFIVLGNIPERGQPLPDEARHTLHGLALSPLPANEALFREPRFWSEYTRVRIPGVPGLADTQVVVVRNEFAAELELRGLVQRVSVQRDSGPAGR
jgi:hypothetical protein